MLVNTEMIRKLNKLIANMENVLEVWIENQANHNISLSLKPNPEQDLNSFKSMRQRVTHKETAEQRLS